MEDKYHIDVVSDTEVKQEYDDGAQVKTEYDSDLENETKGMLLKAEFTEILNSSILKKEFAASEDLKKGDTTLNLNYQNNIKKSQRHVKGPSSKWVCRLCHRKFNRKGALTKHMKYNCNMNPKKIMINKLYSCDICNQQYGRKDILNKHKLIHTRTDLDKFECYDCGRIYTTKDGIRKHINVKHLNIKDDVVCYHCHKEFNDKTYRNFHMKHYCPLNKSKTKPPPSRCQYCGIKFVNRYMRINHMKHCIT